MIKVTNLVKKYNDHVVLNHINLEVKEGEVLAIIGPSGSGKSTLLRCLNFLEKPDSGVIEIGNVRIDTNNYTSKDIDVLRQQTAMVFQHYNLFKNKTALENIIESLVINKKLSLKNAKELGKKLLGQVGLLEKAAQYPITLSGGQQQRVSIARALAVNPHAILFDEPTSSLDPELVIEVLQVIRSIAEQNTTMIIVTHEMAFAREVADKILFMVEGNIVEFGTPEQIFTNPQNPRTKQFLKQ